MAFVFFFQAEDGIRDYKVTGVQTCALPISGAEAELEASARDRVQCRRGHRDGRRAAVPDAEDAGPKRDPRRARRRLGEQHSHVVRPRLRHEEAVVAEPIALGGELDDRLAPQLQQHDGKTDSWAHALSSCSKRTPSGRPVARPKYMFRPFPDPTGAS